jgi:hypothetical protein
MSGRAKPHLELKQNGARWSFDYRTPESILPKVRNKEDLLATMQGHANPFIKMHTVDSPEARRHHVEKVRPAMRWFCKKFGVNIPSWLEGNAHYDELPKEESESLFGEGPLKTREFEEWSTTPKADHPSKKEGA